MISSNYYGCKKYYMCIVCQSSFIMLSSPARVREYSYKRENFMWLEPLQSYLSIYSYITSISFVVSINLRKITVFHYLLSFLGTCDTQGARGGRGGKMPNWPSIHAVLFDGWAPTPSQYLTLSLLNRTSFTPSELGMGLYVPSSSMCLPSLLDWLA